MHGDVDGVPLRVRLAALQPHRAEIAGAQVGLLGGEQALVAERLAGLKIQIGAQQGVVELGVAGQFHLAEAVARAAVHVQHHPGAVPVPVHFQAVAAEHAFRVAPVDQQLLQGAFEALVLVMAQAFALAQGASIQGPLEGRVVAGVAAQLDVQGFHQGGRARVHGERQPETALLVGVLVILGEARLIEAQGLQGAAGVVAHLPADQGLLAGAGPARVAAQVHQGADVGGHRFRRFALENQGGLLVGAGGGGQRQAAEENQCRQD